MNTFPKDLIDVEALDNIQIQKILDRAEILSKSPQKLQQNLPSQAAAQKIWCTFFTEPSTRTKLSFQIAIQNANQRQIDFLPEHSSLKKNESLLDTFWTLEAMGVHGVVSRTEFHDELVEVSKETKIRILNGGSGIQSHPTQALLDVLTLKQAWELAQNPDAKVTFAKKKIAFVGDVGRSRVARSGRALFEKLNAKVFCAGPDEWITPDWQTAHTSMEEITTTADAIILLRAQLERNTKMVMPAAEYLSRFGMTAQKLKQMKTESFVLHPGPCNRGIEITEDVIRDPRCLMLKQVQNGVALRTALIETFSNGAY